jgi:hypothetical protein
MYPGRRWRSNRGSLIAESAPPAIIVDFESLTSARSFFLLGALVIPGGANQVNQLNLGFKRGRFAEKRCANRAPLEIGGIYSRLDVLGIQYRALFRASGMGIKLEV